jgi:hypothetical protein
MRSNGIHCGRPLLVVAIVIAALTTLAPVAYASTTTTVAAPTSACGVAASDLVRVVTTDSPCTVATHVGGSFEIVLRSGWTWGTPQSNSKSIIISDVEKSSMGVASAVLTATSVGVATIHTTGTFYCAKGTVCPELAMLWTLQVIVTKSAAASLTLHLTSGDSSNTYTVRKGDRLHVSLLASAQYTWNEPSAATSTVVGRVSGRAGASASGLFVARRSGRTRLVATQEPSCAAGCASKPHRFSVTVVVTK